MQLTYAGYSGNAAGNKYTADGDGCSLMTLQETLFLDAYRRYPRSLDLH